MKKLITSLLNICLFIFATQAQAFTLKPGDLLFQDLNCGTLCNGIDKVTYGINRTYISHVGMIVSTKPQPVVIEAVSRGVVLTPLNQFLDRSHDANGQPMVIVERLKPQYQALIPRAIAVAKSQLNKPYNATFAPNNGDSFYCSSLIYYAFAHANNGNSIFHQHSMNFNDPKTGKVALDWLNYFKDLHAQIPQGKIGNNPGMMSRESALYAVYHYGHLRTQSESSLIFSH